MKIKDYGLVLTCSYNFPRGDRIIPSQEDAIPNLEILDQRWPQG